MTNSHVSNAFSRTYSAVAFFASVFIILGTTFAPMTALAAGEVSTDLPSGETQTDATLNATVGATNADDASFWVSASSGIDTSNPFAIPSGVCSTPTVGGTVLAGASFSKLLSSNSIGPVCGISITPGTTYYYVAWVNIGGTWYPGAEQSVTTAPVPHTDVYVDEAAGNDSNDGSMGSPFATIQHGYDIVDAGGTVHVATGTYEQGSSQVSVSKSVTFEGPNAATSPNGGSRVAEAIIHGSASGSTATFNVTSSSVNVAIRGFEFENMGASVRSDAQGATIELSKNIFTGAFADGMGFDNPNLTVDDNLFTSVDTPNSDLIQLWVSGGPLGSVSFTNNYFTSVTSDGGLNLSDVSGTISGNHFDGVQYYGVLLAGAPNLTINDNVFNNITNPDSGTSDTWGSGIRLYDGSTATANIHDNTFSNSYLGVAVKPTADASGISLQDNSFSGNGMNVRHKGTNTLDATPNYWGVNDLAGVTATIDGSGTTDYKPWYLDSVGGTLSNVTTITSFDIVSPSVTGAVNNGAHTVTLVLPSGTDASSLTPTIVFTGSSVLPNTGVANDFSSSPLTYTVTSVDETVTQDYAVSTTEDQAITVDTSAPANATYGDVFGVVAHSDSGLGVAITVTGGCSGSGTDSTTVTMTSGTNDCVVHYNQSGDSLFNPAPEVTENVTTHKVELTVTASTNTKVYDGTADAAALPFFSPALISGDTPVFTESYDTKDVGTGKTLTPAGSVDDGTGGNNYNVTFVAVTTGVITKSTLLATADNQEITYGDSDPAFTYQYTGFMPGDAEGDLNTAPSCAVFVSHTDAGTYPIICFGGSDNNYSFTYHTGSLVVDKKALTGHVVADDKTYDGTDAATFSYGALDGIVGGDDVSMTGGTATFSDKNVHTNKTVTVNGLTLTGSSAHNYTVNSTATDDANITEKNLTATVSGIDSKVYDGNTNATVTLSTDALGGDDVTPHYTHASYDDANVGTTHVVTATGVSITGSDALNYNLLSNTSVSGATGVITVKSVNVEADAKSKVYANPSNPDPALTYDADALIGADTYSGALVRDAGENAGTYEINQGTLTAGSNYSINYTGADFTIDKADQNISFGSLSDKNYGDADFMVSASVDSDVDGLSVYFTASGACTVTGTTVHLTTKGDCTITAHQDGNSNWNAASTVEQTFTVYDVTGPVITLMGGATMSINQGTVFVDPGYTATDDVDGDVTANVVVAGSVNVNHFGDYVLTYDVMDAEGNAATQVTRTVTVVHVVHSVGGGGGGRPIPSDVGEVLGASSFNFTIDLHYGSTGDDVIELQKILIKDGFLHIDAPTGWFGPLTEAAVKLYQAAHGIITTGYVGPLTRAALNAEEAAMP